MIERLPSGYAPDADHAGYMMLLDRALEDRLVTAAEAESLFEAARGWGLTREDVRATHEGYLRGLVGAAQSDGVVTNAEQRDLEMVADLLGLSRESLGRLLTVQGVRAPDINRGRAELKGKSVCFTGALVSSIGGDVITRELAWRLAEDAGLVIHDSVTKKLGLLVVADPNTSSGKAKKARAYGTRIMAEAAFWKAIGVQVK